MVLRINSRSSHRNQGPGTSAADLKLLQRWPESGNRVDSRLPKPFNATVFALDMINRGSVLALQAA
jgi:hypothetical protein